MEGEVVFFSLPFWKVFLGNTRVAVRPLSHLSPLRSWEKPERPVPPQHTSLILGPAWQTST